MPGHGGKTILRLPGWTMSTLVYERQLSYFENSDEFRFITLDPRAHGQSSKIRDGHFYEQHGRDLHAFGEHLMFWERVEKFNRILKTFARGIRNHE